MSNLVGCTNPGLGMTYGTELSVRKVILLSMVETYPNCFKAHSSKFDDHRTILNFSWGDLCSTAHMDACRPFGSEMHWMATGIHSRHSRGGRGWRGAEWGGQIFRITSIKVSMKCITEVFC